MARSSRARRFREARAFKHGFDDGLFREGDRSLADVDADDAGAVSLEDAELETDVSESWDPDEALRRDDP